MHVDSVVACLIAAATCLIAVVYLDAAGTDLLGLRDLAFRGVFASALLARGIGSTGALIAVLRPGASEAGDADDCGPPLTGARTQSEVARRVARDALSARLQQSAQLLSVRLDGADEVRAWRARVQSWYDGTYLVLRERVSS